jgi:hypothetical protein
MIPVRYAIALFALSGWPFIWRDHQYVKMAGLVSLVVVSVIFLRSYARARVNVFTVGFVIYLAIVLLSTIASERPGIRAAGLTRAVIYVFLAGGVLAMSSIEFEELGEAAKAILWTYLVLSLPSLVIFFSFLAGMDLPYRNIDLSSRGSFYRLYPFGVVSEDTIFSFFDTNIVRINGFSEEPGVLGTYVVFFLILNQYLGKGTAKRVAGVLLHLLGILSFSLFYYLSALIFLLGAWLDGFIGLLRGGQVRLPSWSSVRNVVCAVAVAVGIVAYVVPGNPVYYLTIARIYAEDQGVLPGDSRRQFNERILEYVRHADVSGLLIGNGPGSNSLDPDIQFGSWGAELYDTGLLSILVVAGMYLFIVGRLSVSRGRIQVRDCLTLVPAVMSFYQRPEVISPIMMVFWIVMARLAQRGESVSQARLRVWPQVGLADLVGRGRRG